MTLPHTTLTMQATDRRGQQPARAGRQDPRRQMDRAPRLVAPDTHRPGLFRPDDQLDQRRL